MGSGTDGMGSKGAELRLTQLWKSFGAGPPAVRDVNLSAAPGEFITLLGPSGSGKTTTLMMVAGFVVPSRGEIFIDGQPVVRLPPQKRNLGMVFQNYALFPHMTVSQNVAFPLEMRKVTRKDVRRRVQQALEMVQLAGYGERLPRQLSGGQQQRVALARALVFNAQALLMDEPLGALDKKLREHMQLEIKHIQQRLHVTVIYVTHDQEEALTMSDRIAVMNQGRIEQLGTPRQLYDEPATSFVADFIGESNFLNGRVLRVDGGLVTVHNPESGEFRAVGEGVFTPGQAVIAAVRPERLSLRPTRAEALDNRWRGRIIESIYAGDATRYRVAVGNTILTVKHQNRESVDTAGTGADVEVCWAASSTRLLAESQERVPNGPRNEDSVVQH